MREKNLRSELTRLAGEHRRKIKRGEVSEEMVFIEPNLFLRLLVEEECIHNMSLNVECCGESERGQGKYRHSVGYNSLTYFTLTNRKIRTKEIF